MKSGKSKNILRIFFLISAGLFLFSLSFILLGCATPTIETAAVGKTEALGWADGRVAEDLDVTLSKVAQAAIQALGALRLNITKTDIKEATALIIGEYLDSSTIWIDLRRISEQATHLEIRVSINGNKEASYGILEKMHSFL